MKMKCPDCGISYFSLSAEQTVALVHEPSLEGVMEPCPRQGCGGLATSAMVPDSYLFSELFAAFRSGSDVQSRLDDIERSFQDYLVGAKSQQELATRLKPYPNIFALIATTARTKPMELTGLVLAMLSLLNDVKGNSAPGEQQAAAYHVAEQQVVLLKEQISVNNRILSELRIIAGVANEGAGNSSAIGNRPSKELKKRRAKALRHK